ncbi:hypothetical protein AB0M22_13955 [Nocardia sp. NPDC051756]|uniref:hypothetical protein n=1 Tax=Nocardia sp. NPDC051756 TaxID=3154751 RepID=UPI00343852D3
MNWRTRWEQWSDRGIQVPLLALAAVALVVACALGFLGYRAWDLSDRNADLAGTLADLRRNAADCAAAVGAGTEFLLAANNFDYRQPEEWTKKLADRSTGPIHDYFANAQVQRDNAELIKAAKVQKHSTVADAACAVHTDKAIRVTAQLAETTQNFQITDPVKTTSAVWVEMTQENGNWKAADSGRGDQSLVGDALATQPPGPPAAPAPPR